MDPVISFNEATKFFGSTHAVDRVRIDIRKVEFVALAGPSGCGKSTALQLGSGLIQPTSGVIARSSDNIGCIFQEPTLMPWRTVEQNVRFWGELEGMSRRRAAATARGAVGQVKAERTAGTAVSRTPRP